MTGFDEEEVVSPVRVSIVVPSYNQGRFLDATLRSLFDQNDPNLEVLLVDGGSTDESIDVIQRWAPRLAWWVSEKDRGQSHAINKGFERATGDWLGWLNSDDLLLPGALAALRAQMAGQPDVQWWTGSGQFIDERGRFLSRYGPPPLLTDPAQLSDWREHWIAQPSTFFSRGLYARAGNGVREDLHYAMDLDLWLRLLKLAPAGSIAHEMSAYRYHEAGKTSAMAVQGEAEIVMVLSEHLGLTLALDRVRLIARDRDAFLRRAERYERLLSPVSKPYSRIKQLLRRIRAHGHGAAGG
ncbi:MAG: glycosyltransferase family 2 protein [Lysobacterales bacterium]